MCIAILSESGIDLPTKEVLKLCFKNNPDGAGYAVLLDTKEWECKKGFMTFKSFWKSFNKEKYIKDDTVIIHFRIGTSGKKDHPDCTHPFPITDIEKDLILHRFVSKNILMHNGTCGSGRENLSDTMVAIIDYIDPLLPYIEINDKIINIIQKCVGSTSRWFIAKENSYWMLGDWVEEKETGIWYSNKGYIPTPVHQSPYIYKYSYNVHSPIWNNKTPVIKKETGSSKKMYFENDKWSWDKWEKLNTPLLEAPKPKDKEYEIFDENNTLTTIIDSKGNIVWEKDEEVEDYDCPYCTNSINDELLSKSGACPYCNEIVNHIMYNMNFDSSNDEENYCCPNCGEQDYLIEPMNNIGDTECCKCGAIFNDNSNLVIGWSDTKYSLKGAK